MYDVDIVPTELYVSVAKQQCIADVKTHVKFFLVEFFKVVSCVVVVVTNLKKKTKKNVNN
jgi:hypothetical protein